MSHPHEFWMNDHQEGGGSNPSRSAKAVKAAALKKRTGAGFEQGRCKHGTANTGYCESCSHPNRAKANAGKVPFKDKMSRRKD